MDPAFNIGWNKELQDVCKQLDENTSEDIG